jgi:hypothetical protein
LATARQPSFELLLRICGKPEPRDCRTFARYTTMRLG